jgi:integrase
MKIDPYKHKERYFKWKEKVKEKDIPGIGKENSELLKHYIADMEKGVNIAPSSAKGSRGFNRLNTLKDRIIFFARKFKELYGLGNITQINEEQLIGFFSDMRNGTIKRRDGRNYLSIDTPANIFKAFWHWHQKISRKKGIEIPDITKDLDVSKDKPAWVYLTENEVKRLCDNAKYEYKVLIMFLFDTGIRSPTELVNVKVSDFFNGFKELNIREETSKTFGRRIKLMLCSELIKDFVKTKNLSQEDYIFSICPSVTNRYLKRLAERVFGANVSPAGARYSELTMYDFRHISCCYWLPRYKSESALKYRFGWKKSDKIHYYSELLGMRDTIAEEDMLIDVTKTEIEKRLEKSEKENNLLREDNEQMKIQMEKIMGLTNRICSQMKVNPELEVL